MAKALLEDPTDRGLDSKQRRLFVLDGALALGNAIDLIFGDRRKPGHTAKTRT